MEFICDLLAHQDWKTLPLQPIKEIIFTEMPQLFSHDAFATVKNQQDSLMMKLPNGMFQLGSQDTFSEFLEVVIFQNSKILEEGIRT